MGNKLKNSSISKRLLVTFGAILVMFALTVLLSVGSLLSIGGNFDTFYNGVYEVTEKAADLKADIQIVAKNIGYSMMEKDEEKTAEYIQNAEDTLQSLRDGTEYMKEHFDGDLTLVDKYDEAMKAVKEDRDKVFEMAANNQNDEAIELYFNNVMPGFKEANDYLTQIGDEASESAAKSHGSANMQKNSVTVILILLSAATLVVTIVLARYLIKSITAPIKEIETAAKEMSLGSLKATIEYESQDELGSLAGSMRFLTEGVSYIVEDIGRILGELAKGNFQVTSQCLDKYVLDYVPILDSMRLIRDNLNSTLHQISDASDQVAAGASQMAQNAQGLAEGATEQAGAIEELTATVEDVAVMAEQSASEANQAYMEVKASSEKAEGGKREMEELIKAMERISTTSKEIENIIAAIEDIAFQTNLLSLNASIEAARAGEAGKGFAVVADQIGKLAADSAQSAVNTKELIGKTLEEIQVGSSITEKTSETFEGVIDDMKSFAEVTKETSEKCMSQFESLKQVQSGIEQISSVVQSNSAAAEETSATSEELSAQAEGLDAQISRFQLV